MPFFNRRGIFYCMQVIINLYFIVYFSGYEYIGEPFHQVLETSGPDEVTYNIYGYKQSSCRLICYHLFSILLGGLPYLLFSLYPKYSVVKFEKCPLQIADLILGKYI